MPQISLLIHTASPDDFLANQGIPSYFLALVESLVHQSHRDFELVYVDTYHAGNHPRFIGAIRNASVSVKHVPVHPDHRYWFDRGNCYISAAKNTGILWADGELLVTCDDAEFFPRQFLERYWYHYQRGRYMHALHKRMTSIRCEGGHPVQPIDGDIYVNDHRWKHVPQHEYFHHHGGLCFAGTSFSIGDALTINGFNERMDGCKSLEDVDFATRISMLGRMFALDRLGYLHIVDHGSYADSPDTNWAELGPDADGQRSQLPVVRRKSIDNFIAVENYGMLRCGIELQDIIANKNPLTEQHWKIIQRDTLKYRHFDPLAPEHAEMLEIWKQTPTFNLKSQRAQLRSSKEWSQLCPSKP